MASAARVYEVMKEQKPNDEILDKMLAGMAYDDNLLNDSSASFDAMEHRNGSLYSGISLITALMLATKNLLSD